MEAEQIKKELEVLKRDNEKELDKTILQLSAAGIGALVVLFDDKSRSCVIDLLLKTNVVTFGISLLSFIFSQYFAIKSFDSLSLGKENWKSFDTIVEVLNNVGFVSFVVSIILLITILLSI